MKYKAGGPADILDDPRTAKLSHAFRQLARPGREALTTMMNSHRGKNSLKLMGPVRGSAVLHHAEVTIDVAVDASEFEERGRTSVTGSLDGPLGELENGAEAKLVLADGREWAIRVIEPDEDGADFRTT